MRRSRASRNSGVRVRCVRSANQKIVAGRSYEVAEILEHPAHVMVRKPNGKWPRPGELYFGLHPEEYFESPQREVPAFTCGYNLYSEKKFFGAVIPNSIFPTPPRIKFPKENAQMKRVSEAVDPEQGRVWWRSFHGILTKFTWPTGLERSFMLLGIEHEYLGRKVSYRSASTAMRRVMRRLSIPRSDMPIVEDQELEFWSPSWRPAGGWIWLPVETTPP